MGELKASDLNDAGVVYLVEGILHLATNDYIVGKRNLDRLQLLYGIDCTAADADISQFSDKDKARCYQARAKYFPARHFFNSEWFEMLVMGEMDGQSIMRRLNDFISKGGKRKYKTVKERLHPKRDRKRKER